MCADYTGHLTDAVAERKGTPLLVQTLREKRAEQVERQQWATDAAAKLRINLRNGDPGGFQKLISSIDDLPQHPQSLEVRPGPPPQKDGC